MLSSDDEILTINLWQCKMVFYSRILKAFLDKNNAIDEDWTTFCRALLMLSDVYTEWAKKVSCCIAGCNFVSYGPV